MKPAQAVLCLFVTVAALLLPGCTSAWEERFTPLEGPSSPLPDDARLDFRQVDFDTAQRFFEDCDRHQRNGGPEISQLPQAEREVWESRLRDALQVSGTSSDWKLIGMSVFWADDDDMPTQDDLFRFARKVGATHVRHMQRELGTVTRSAMVPTGYTVQNSQGYSQTNATARARAYNPYAPSSAVNVTGNAQSATYAEATTSSTTYGLKQWGVARREHKVLYLVRK